MIARLSSPVVLLASFLASSGAPGDTNPYMVLHPRHVAQRSAHRVPQVCPALGKVPMPIKYKGDATVPAITACDLMTRLYIYADDSLMGRRVGTDDNLRATAYIEREVRRFGLKPAGDSGGFFQYLPVIERRFDSASTISVNGLVFRPGDFTAASQTAHQVSAAPAIFGGTTNDTSDVLSVDSVRGRVLVLRAQIGGGSGRRIRPPFSPQRQAYESMISAASAVLTISGEPRGARASVIARGGPSGVLEDPAQARTPVPPSATIQGTVVEEIFGRPSAELTKGMQGKSVALDIRMVERSLPSRNVVAILPGSDRKLRGEYVAIGAHNDHNGYTVGGAVEHDSLKAYNIFARVQGGDTRSTAPPTDEVWKQINAMKDSLRRAHGGPRMDSIQNGADDDGSGSVAVLEIAEAFAKGKIKPKRSIIFVWHTGEEAGLWGSQWFTNHPTVPRDSIVAQLNMDMVGRGEAMAATGQSKDGGLLQGGPNYLQLVGSRRLSTELGDIVEQVDRKEKTPLTIDYSIDADGHPQRIYCRSDHFNYARYGIPVTFFTTGGHADYHQNTDEPQYIQYSHMARVSQLVFDVAVKVANLDHRVVVDKSRPASPFAACVQ